MFELYACQRPYQGLAHKAIMTKCAGLGDSAWLWFLWVSFCFPACISPFEMG
jgi:hypothetical protein